MSRHTPYNVAAYLKRNGRRIPLEPTPDGRQPHGDPDMDLTYTEKYQQFRQEVRAFIENNKDAAIPDDDNLVYKDIEGTRRWQELLIENGYACRTIPKEYGGYGKTT